MIRLPDKFTGKESYWGYNPQHEYIFDDIYKKDKSKDKSESSKIMWALYCKCHPKSDFYNLPNKDEIIAKKFIGDEKFNWDKYSKLESLFKASILTQAERSLHEWNEYMQKRDEFLKSQEYYFDHFKDGVLVKGTAKQLDDAWRATTQMYNDYDKIMKQYAEESIKRGKGGKAKSLLDGGEI